jgi:hypothetical protein
MQKSTYGKIDRIFKEIIQSPPNRALGEEAQDGAGNFILAFCLSPCPAGQGTGGKKPPAAGIQAAALVSQLNEKAASRFTFPGTLHIPANALGRLQALKRTDDGEYLPGVAFEYLKDRLDKDGGGRKKSGAYYTPSWVIRDMVAAAVKPRLTSFYEGFRKAAESCDTFSFIRAWDRLGEFRILDPSCGWGAFLIEVYRELERFYLSLGELAREIQCHCAMEPFDGEDLFSRDYLDLVEENAILSGIRKTCSSPGQRIMQDHLYGLDLDPLSAAVASLAVQAEASGQCRLEDPPGGTRITQEDFIHWMEAPPAQFDVVLGNPPYFTIGGGGKGRGKGAYHALLKKHPLFAPYFRSQSDIFYYFAIGGIKILKPGGVISFIVPAYWLDNEFADSLRGEMLQACRLEEMVSFAPLPVFRRASGRAVGVDTLIFRAAKDSAGAGDFPAYFPKTLPGAAKAGPAAAREFLEGVRAGEGTFVPVSVSHARLGRGKWLISPGGSLANSLVKDGVSVFPLGDVPEPEMAKFPGEFAPSCPVPLEGICQVGQGQETGLSGVFVVSAEKARALGLEMELLRPNVKNGDIRRYYVEPPGSFIIMTRDGDDLERFPGVKRYLDSHMDSLKDRQRVRLGIRKPHSISIPQNYDLFSEIPKIVVPYRASGCRFALDNYGRFNDGGDVRAIVIKPRWRERISYAYLLALLNSRLVEDWFREAGKRKGSMLEFFSRPLSRIPVRIPPAPLQEEIASLAEQVMEIRKGSPGDPDSLALSLEKKIDGLIMGIYGIEEAGS